jgi:hypothetical protein
MLLLPITTCMLSSRPQISDLRSQFASISIPTRAPIDQILLHCIRSPVCVRQRRYSNYLPFQATHCFHSTLGVKRSQTKHLSSYYAATHCLRAVSGGQRNYSQHPRRRALAWGPTQWAACVRRRDAAMQAQDTCQVRRVGQNRIPSLHMTVCMYGGFPAKNAVKTPYMYP